MMSLYKRGFCLVANASGKKDSGYITMSGINTSLRRCNKCSELTSPKSVREKKSTASEREWLLLMAETYLREDALKAEKD